MYARKSLVGLVRTSANATLHNVHMSLPQRGIYKLMANRRRQLEENILALQYH